MSAPRSSAPATQASPPLTTDTTGEKSCPTAPASTLPTAGAVLTWARYRLLTRPRRASGVYRWSRALRSTSEIRSPAPASARNASAQGRLCTSPNAVIAPPQITPAPITTTPGRRRWPTQPLVAPPMTAPSPGAAVSRPNVADPPWKCWAASAGNSAVGMPKIIALVSTRSMPPTTGLCRTNFRPWARARSPRPGRSSWLAGGSGRTTSMASPNAANAAASIP